MAIEGWVYRSFGDVEVYGNGTDLRVDCPFCREYDTSKHLHISTVKNACHCFKCDYSNSWTGLITDVDGVQYSEAIDEIGEQIVPLYILLSEAAEVETPEVAAMPSTFITIADALQISGATASSALMAKLYIERRLSPYIDSWGMYIDKWGVWKTANGYGKIVFPVENGWWQHRAIANWSTGPKYVSCKLPKNDVLYNYSALYGYKSVNIAEGIISAACLGSDSVALCGKKATDAQLKRLGIANAKHYTICLDADAREYAIDLADELARYGKSATIRLYANGGDPASETDFEDVEYSFATSVALRL